MIFLHLKNYSGHFIQDEEEANDIVQDVFLKLWSKRDTLSGVKNKAGFLFTLLRNKCLNSLKKKVIEGKYRQQQTQLESERLYYISFDQAEEFESMREKLSLEFESMIKAMPEKCGIAFRLKWMEGKKIKEIASLMHISTTMVDKHLAKGMEIARKKFKEELLLVLLFIG